MPRCPLPAPAPELSSEPPQDLVDVLSLMSLQLRPPLPTLAFRAVSSSWHSLPG